jgi:hypothetical protein
MPTVVIRHKVGDLNTWLKGHQDRVELFSNFATGFQTFQDTEDPESVVLVVDVFDLDRMQALMRDPEVAVTKEKHTVKEPIIVSLPVEIPVEA